jgi:very-short-patch-repair endonuclease
MDRKKQSRNSLFRLKLISRATPQEIIFRDFLESKGISFIFQKGFLSPFHRIVDFYIKKYRLIVEIDGGYHENTTSFDQEKDKTWRRFRTLRIKNSQVDDGTFKKIFEAFVAQ